MNWSVAGLVVAVAFGGWSCGGGSTARSVLTSVAQVRALDPDEAHEARPVLLRGVVTFHNVASHRLILQDDTGGLSVDLGSLGFTSSLQGQRVDVDGVTGRGDRVAVVINPRIRGLGEGTLPKPRPISIHQLGEAVQDDQWVALRGVVRSAFVQHDGALALDVVADGRPFKAVLERSGGIVFSTLIDSTVRVSGVASSTVGARGEVIQGRLLVPSDTQVEVEEAVAADPFAVEARAIGSLAGQQATPASEHRIRIRGTVVSEDPGDGILVRDATGQTLVRPAHSLPLVPGEEVDVLGFLRPGALVSLEHASVRRVGVTPSEGGSPEASGPLRTAKSVQGLSAEHAARGRDVRLDAVVTFYDPDWTILFVQDATGGIFVNANGLGKLDLHAGDRVVLEGITDPGEFAPQVVNPRVRRLGGGSLPAGQRVSVEQLLTGRLDSQWVEAEGIVRSTTQDDGHLVIEVAAGLYGFRMHCPVNADPDMLRQLVDARVRVRGASGTLFNEKKQLIGVQLFVPDLSYLSVLERGTADPFSLPTRSVASLLQFDPLGAQGHRVHVQGVTTLRRAEGVFIQDQTGGLLLQTDDVTPLQPGDRVEAVGFAAPGEYTPVLRDAIIRKVKAGPAPGAPLITAADAATGNHDATLVRLEAYLLERTTLSSHEQVLTLQAGKTLFNAVLPRDAAADRLSALEPGSLLQLTGLCAVQADISRATPVARSFRLLLRSAEDVTVVARAPWWTTRHAVWGGSAMALVTLVVLAWVALLRRQVREQTEIIQRRQRELLTAEKMASLGRLTAGIAHEMNTPLATVRAALFEMQKLTDEYGASIADASVTADDHREINVEMQRTVTLAEKAAEKAAGFVRGIKSQTRDVDQEDRQFPAAPVIEEALLLLGHAARKANCTLEFDGTREPVELRGLPGRLAQVVTNLVTNALDASAGTPGARIRLQLERSGSDVHLKVGDQGTGIPPEILPRIFEPMFTSKPFGEGTGLGLSIVHDIVTGHFGGKIKVLSEIGRGTTFEIVLPRRHPEGLALGSCS